MTQPEEVCDKTSYINEQEITFPVTFLLKVMEQKQLEMIFLVKEMFYLGICRLTKFIDLCV